MLQVTKNFIQETYKLDPNGTKSIFYKLHKGRDLWFQLEQKLKSVNEISDNEIWSYFKKEEEDGTLESYLSRRGKYRASEIFMMIKDICTGKTPSKCTYLDIGSGDGYIAYNLSQNLTQFYNCNMTLYAIDIINQLAKSIQKEIIFKTYNGWKIPLFKGVNFKVMTLIMVTHHINDDMLIKLLKNIESRLLNGGYLIIRDHNINDNITARLTTIQHRYYDYIEEEEYVKTDEKLYLRSSMVLKKIIYDNTKLRERRIVNYPKFRFNVTKYYYKVFQKPLQ